MINEDNFNENALPENELEDIKVIVVDAEKTNKETQKKFVDNPASQYNDCNFCVESPTSKEIITRVKVCEKFVKTWHIREKRYDKLRNIFVRVFIRIMCIQLILLNLLVIANGIKVIHFSVDKTVLIALCTEVFAQIITIILFMVKYLFNQEHDKLLEGIVEIISIHTDNNTK